MGPFTIHRTILGAKMSFTVAGFPRKQLERLLWLGVVAMSQAGTDNKSMPDAIDNLQNSGRNITEVLQPILTAHGVENPIVSIPVALSVLQSIIPTLPRDNCWRRVKGQYIGMIICTFFFLLLRFLTRKIVNKRVRRDDWAMLIAFLFCFTLPLVISYDASSKKLGHHIYELSYNEFRGLLLWTYTLEISYITCIYVVRLALLTFYWDLSPQPNFRRSLKAMFIFTTIMFLAAIFSITFICKPAAFWRDPVNATCKNRPILFLFLQCTHIVADWVTLLLPVPAVLRLKLGTRDKITVLAMFGVGGFACMAGLFRVLYIRRHHNDPDIISHLDFMTLWLQLEISLAICLSCTPTIKLFICSILLRRRQKHSASYYASYSDSNSRSNPSKNSKNNDPAEDDNGVGGSQPRSKVVATRNHLEEQPELEEIELACVPNVEREDLDRAISTAESTSRVIPQVDENEICTGEDVERTIR